MFTWGRNNEGQLGVTGSSSVTAEANDKFLATSFAGFDYEAVNRIREHLLPYPPSSPSVALFKDGKLVHFVERHHIEGASAQMVANNLAAAFEEYC